MYATRSELLQSGLLFSQCNHRRKSTGKPKICSAYSRSPGIKLSSKFLRSYSSLQGSLLRDKGWSRYSSIQAQHSTGTSNKRDIFLEEEALKMLLDEQQGGSDFTAEVLKSTPSQVEAKYLVDGKFYTLREKELQKLPLFRRIANALKLQRRAEIEKEKEILHGDLSETHEQDHQQRLGAKKSVYLSDLLREYKGELYVPEEAFKAPSPDLNAFQKNMQTLPLMTFGEFLKAAKAGQVTLLTSRGMLGSRKYIYHDFIVELKNIPGEEILHRTRRAMHLTDAEAQVGLREYTGPQVEVETQYTPYIAPPPSLPNPVASSISGKVVLELAVASGLIATMAYTIGGFVSAVAFMGISMVTITMAYVVVPILIPLLWPIQALTIKLIQGLGIILFGGFTSRRGLPAIISKLYGYFTSSSWYTNVRLLAVMLLVGGCMALIAKFTLTRRPKDFRKWDLWQAIEFGQSKPQARVEGTTGVQFADIAGIDEVVGELQELVTYLKNPDRFNQMGTKPPHGVLLEGPPGCGKTLLAKAIAGEAGVPFYQMAGSEFVEVLVGVGAARVRDLFKRAKVNRPSVVFIDEIDALGAMRQGGDGEELDDYNAGSQERETTLNQLLIELDGFDTGKGVIFLGATNRMDMLDPALLRPGRFDRKITVKPPRAKGRLEILNVHARSVNLGPDVDLWTVAKNLTGWTGAELAQLLQEGALLAVRNGHKHVLQRDLDQAADRITIGPQRTGLGRGLAVHRRMATLEVGLAMTTHLLRRLEGAKLESCERISIIPRGETQCRTIFGKLDDEDYFFQRRPQLLHRMQILLGGRAAEELLYGRDTSSWTVQYLRDASWMARKLVTIWNMEGPLTVRGECKPWKREHQFSGPPLDFEGSLYDDYRFEEPSLNYDIDHDVAKFSEDLMRKMYGKTLKMLQRHQAALTKAIYVLLDKEEIYGDELDLILDNYPEGIPVQLVENEVDPAALPASSGSKYRPELSPRLVGISVNSKNEN